MHWHQAHEEAGKQDSEKHRRQNKGEEQDRERHRRQGDDRTKVERTEQDCSQNEHSVEFLL